MNMLNRSRSGDAPADREFSFKTYANRFIQKGRQLARVRRAQQELISAPPWSLLLDNDNWGLVRHFGTRMFES